MNSFFFRHCHVNIRKPGIAVAMLAAISLSGCGAGSEEDPEGFVRVFKAPTLGAALAGPVDTDALTVAREFNFDTSRSIDIALNIEEAREVAATVSVCTDFVPGGGAFDVDYSSCGLQGEMVDGRFNRQMLVTNEYDSVAVVVWFRDSDLPPVYQEIPVDEGKQ